MSRGFPSNEDMRLATQQLAHSMQQEFDWLRTGEFAQPVPSGCLTDEQLAAVADARAPETTVSHLSRCASCRAAVIDLRRAIQSEPIGAEIASLATPRWASDFAPRVIGLVAAAAIVVLVARVAVELSTSRPDILRDHPANQIESRPQVHTPRPVQGERPVFSWSPVVTASQYRITLFDEEGAVVWQDVVADTTANLPRGTAIAAGTSYWWQVEARVDFDRWVASELTNFTPR